jgi:type II secretion system protein I
VRSQPGFTLLEAVIALAIIGTAAVAALASVGAEMRTAERAQRYAEAEVLAHDRLARLELLAPEELRRLPDSLARGRFHPPLAAYTWTASTRPVVGERFLEDVIVRVDWESGSYALHTRLYRPSPSLDGTP